MCGCIRATVRNTCDRLPSMVEAFAKLPTRAAILDGELCLIEAGGGAHFYRLMRQMQHAPPRREPVDVYGLRSAAPRWG